MKNSDKMLWKSAKKFILNGNSLFSKNPENYSSNWPAYYISAKGCKIKTLNGKIVTDFSYMGVGTNLLGYANTQVDTSVKNIINKGTMSTLNCTEELYLSKKIIKMHPWADMCKFTRTGAEASAVAVRIGRSYSKKNKVAISGYHGWHDWYLSANLKNNKNLDTHLLPNLKTSGVDKKLTGNSIPFRFNSITSFKNIISKHKDIGVVIMEVARQQKATKRFLQYIRNYTKRKKITLIFDECSSGFRETYGGIHLKYRINPDICILGKALGNGYPINVIFGTKRVMNSGKNSFISSTFWSDRVGPAAALKTLEIMKKKKTWKKISETGLYIKKNIDKIFKKYSFKGKISGLDSLIFFEIEGINNNKLKKIIAKEMIKHDILATNAIYVSISHSRKIIKQYLEALEIVLKKLQKNFKKN